MEALIIPGRGGVEEEKWDSALLLSLLLIDEDAFSS